jgi:hypothetical protein
MEQLPRPDEQADDEYTRPHIEIDLQGPDGKLFNVISIARQHLTGHALQSFNQTVWAYTEYGAGKTYDDMLGLVNTYMDLLDTSDLYPQYGRGAHVMAAVDTLNNRLHLLPPGIESPLTGLYPELDDPDMGPDKYVLLLEEELQRVEGELAICSKDKHGDWMELRTELLRCRSALRRAGVHGNPTGTE